MAKKKTAHSAKKAGSAKSKSGSAKKKNTNANAKSGKKKGKGSAGKKEGGKVEEVLREPDMLDQAAMHNLYYMAHGVPDALELRGYHWADAPKKKGKKKK